MQRVIVNEEQCARVADVLKGLKLRESHEGRDFVSLDADRETKLRVYLLISAICHQTRSLTSRKLRVQGWQWMERVFVSLAKQGSTLLDPAHLAAISVGELSRELAALFSDDGDPAHTKLDRLEERSRFMIEAAKLLVSEYGGKVSRLVDASEGYLLHNGGGLYERLEKLEAFSDPLRKKSSLFVKLLQDAGLFKAKDAGSLVPIIDYHKQRVLLRMGCVEVVDKELKRKLLGKERIDSDDDVRAASIDAARLISRLAGTSLTDATYVLWALGRSCCRGVPLCRAGKCELEPCTLMEVVELPSHKRCVFEKACKGATDDSYASYWEPVVDTHYY
jgi:hypothetical protein